jgi:hypothetical protein
MNVPARWSFGLMVLALLSFGTASAQTLHFSEQLTYSYQKEGKLLEMSVYLNRKTSTWLFTNDDSFGGKAEGISYVVAYANGTYLTCGPDEANQTTCLRYKATVPPSVPAPKTTGPGKRFGQNRYGWPTLVGKRAVVEAGRLRQPTYLATVPFRCTPLYAYNALIGIETYLPVFQQLNYVAVLPPNQLVLHEDVPGGATFKSLSPTEYTIDLRGVRTTAAPR